MRAAGRPNTRGSACPPDHRRRMGRCPRPPATAVNERDRKLQRWAIISLAVVEAVLIAAVLILRSRG